MTIEIRQARSEDAPAVRAMFERSTPQSRYRRFFSHSSVGPELEVHRIEDAKPLVAVVAIDPDRGVVIGLATSDLTDGAGDLAVFVEDSWQAHGIGNCLMRAVMRQSRSVGIETVTARVLWDNPAPLHMMRRAFPDAPVSADHGEYLVGPVHTLRRHGQNAIAVEEQAGPPRRAVQARTDAAA
jgi:L-amino acid N-acyltransferase YncA